ncbi:MAG TPA: Flp pilus assembly protein CpaB, partial [Candidatus Limnocylindrales bacterium]|nr:Flp pilus assembly protein CpaB [Candidatus Limnocylindrales bacterium]
ILIGIFLAIVAFVAVFYLLQDQGGGGGGESPASRTTTPTVFAAKDIPLGTQVTEDMLRLEEEFPNEQRTADAFNSTSLVVGKIARQDIVEGQQVRAENFSTGSLTSIDCPDTLRCIAVQVDQVTGVGTLIRAGDYVDVLVGFTGDKFPVVQINPDEGSITPVAGISGTTVKVLLQGLQVQGVLLPPPPAQDGTQQDGGTTSGDQPTNLTGQQEIVILSGTAQQMELIKFAQLDGNISLVLRSAGDFRDPNDPTIPVTPIPDVTSGVILKTLVDDYGVLVPEIIELILPEATPAP